MERKHRPSHEAAGSSTICVRREPAGRRDPRLLATARRSVRRRPRARHGAALHFFRMAQSGAVPQAGSLPYGAQRRLEILRALAYRAPACCCLDEPAAGMNPSETAELMENIRTHPRYLPDRRAPHRARYEPGHGYLRGHLPCSATARVIAKGTPADITVRSHRHRGLPGP